MVRAQSNGVAMTARPTTLVESDQLAQAAANVIRSEAFVPKGRRWPFSRISKAHRDYYKAVQEITTRRREARENAVEQKIKKELADANAIFERARASAQTAHDDELAETKKPYDATETKARSERDAAIAAANLAYQKAVEEANATYLQEAAVIDRKRAAVIAEATAAHDESCTHIKAKSKTDLAQIAKDMKTIPLEGPMRIVEDRQAWASEERKKALIGIVDMAGQEELDAEYADLCLRNVADYVFQDRYLKPDAQHHRLMDVNLLEALVDLAGRTPDKRPTIVKYMHDIVVQNPGHTSPAFIRNLTELYVTASADTRTVYDDDPIQNEAIVESMRAHIADTLKLTPRRNQVPSSPTADNVTAREAAPADFADDQKTPVVNRPFDVDITADVDLGDLFLLEASDTADSGAEMVTPVYLTPPSGSSKAPPLPPAPSRRVRKTHTPEGSN
jgi:hypothetical protein